MNKKDYVSPEMNIKHIDFTDILTSSVQTSDSDKGLWYDGDEFGETTEEQTPVENNS